MQSVLPNGLLQKEEEEEEEGDSSPNIKKFKYIRGVSRRSSMIRYRSQYFLGLLQIGDLPVQNFLGSSIDRRSSRVLPYIGDIAGPSEIIRSSQIFQILLQMIDQNTFQFSYTSQLSTRSSMDLVTSSSSDSKHIKLFENYHFVLCKLYSLSLVVLCVFKFLFHSPSLHLSPLEPTHFNQIEFGFKTLNGNSASFCCCYCLQCCWIICRTHHQSLEQMDSGVRFSSLYPNIIGCGKQLKRLLT